MGKFWLLVTGFGCMVGNVGGCVGVCMSGILFGIGIGTCFVGFGFAWVVVGCGCRFCGLLGGGRGWVGGWGRSE